MTDRMNQLLLFLVIIVLYTSLQNSGLNTTRLLTNTVFQDFKGECPKRTRYSLLPL